MSIARKVTEGASGSGGSETYVDDVFSTYLYTGNVSNRSIVNGIDLDDKGGLVWIKVRSAVAYSHELFDTERGAFKTLRSNTTLEEYDYTDVQAGLASFNSDGFSVTSSQAIGTNVNNIDMASWTFAKQKGFFDVVTYTGDGVFNAERQIPHNLGSVPGMIVVKPYSAAGSWPTYHRSLNNDNAFTSQNMFLNDTFDAGGYTGFATHDKQTSEYITLYSADDRTNNAGVDYIAYIFAHDAPMFGPDGDESIIKCGKFSGQNPLGTEVDLGWEPQFVLFKEATGFGDWSMYDSMRGVTTGGDDAYISPNQSSAESVVSSWVDFNPTGFTTYLSTSPTTEYIYMAIRRPNKPAEEFEPEELFATVPDSGQIDPTFVSGFPADAAIQTKKSGYDKRLSARLTSGSYLETNNSNGSSTSTSNYTWDFMNGWNNQTVDPADWFSTVWRRAPGFFDVVTYEGDSQYPRSIPHNLGVVPEMMWVKTSNGVDNWRVYSKDMDVTQELQLNETYAASFTGSWGSEGRPTSSSFIAGSANTNYSGRNYIAFLWASVPGISKVGSYEGNGSNDGPTVECGFVPRFVLIKSIDGSGSWHYFDALRGFTKVLSLNTADAQVNEPTWVAQTTSGFKIGNNANSINKAGLNYLFYAIA